MAGEQAFSADRAQRLLALDTFRTAMDRIRSAEETRVFCGHGYDHAADVARAAWIKVLERQAGISKDVVYAAAFLHDIGRAEEYENGTPHEEAAVRMAEPLLREAGFDEPEIGMILTAVAGHRKVRAKAGGQSAADDPKADGAAGSGDAPRREIGVKSDDRFSSFFGEDLRSAMARASAAVLREILQEADHEVRQCFVCPARNECRWNEEEKNTTIW